jgi:small GTP-binding protein
VYERFTERARKVVVLAQDEARYFNHNDIGTEYLLLGLLREDEGVAAQALYSLNVTLDEVREQVESIVGFGVEGTSTQGRLTSRSKKVLEFALREALELGHNYIGTEHVLLGLVRESEGVAARVLSNLDVEPDEVRREVVGRLGSLRKFERSRRQRFEEAELERERANVPHGLELRFTANHQASIGRLSWSPNGQVLAAPASDTNIYLWDLDTEMPRELRGHTGAVFDVAWSPDGRTLASASADETVRMWDVETEAAIFTLEGDRYRVEHDSETGEEVAILVGNEYAVTSIAWSPREQVIAVGYSNGAIRLRSTTTAEIVKEFEGHEGAVNSVVWSPDGRTLASASADETIRVWDVESERLHFELARHSDEVLDLAWSPDGRLLASVAGGQDPTIRIWNLAAQSSSTLQTDVLDAHTLSVTSVSFSADGNFLASRADDSMVVLWHQSHGTWTPATELIEIVDSANGQGRISFNPLRPVLATLGTFDSAVRIWSLDVAVLAGDQRSEFVRHTSAKVVLVGESNVGKSWLAMRLAEDRHPEAGEVATTHGMRLWEMPPDRLDPSYVAPAQERRDVVLWDMGGQEEYRLVHQLFLHDTTLALVLVDPTRGLAALNEVEEWNKRLEKQLGDRPLAKLLVGSKVDDPSDIIDRPALEQVIQKCGFVDYVESSALKGRGIDRLKQLIAENLNWDSLTTTSRLEAFQRIRDEIGRRRKGGEVVLPLTDLKSSLDEMYPDAFDEAAISSEVEKLALQGIIANTRLASGEQMLVLRIEEVERYAGSLILAARNNPRSVPALEERTLATPSLPLPGIKEQDRLPYYPEIAVLECVVELLIQHGICFRHEGLLIFPSLFSESQADLESKIQHSVSLNYDFTGAIDNIYASLVARLVVGGGFGEHRLWANRVEFDEPGKGVCGIRQIRREGGLAHIDVFFAEDTEQDRRDFFINFVEDHLRRHGVEVTEHQAIKCRCGEFEFAEEIVRKKLAMGQKHLLCPICEKPTLISEGVQSIRERSQESYLNIVALKTDLLREEIKDRTDKDAQKAKQAVSHKTSPQTTNLEQSILILHLSDLHFSGEVEPATKLQWLMDDIQGDQGLRRRRLDYLVISGDMTDKGKAPGLENARQFVSALIESFGLSSERCILVPGNHDVQDRDDYYQWSMDVDGLDPKQWVRQGDIYLVRDKDKYPLRFQQFSDAFFHKIIPEPYPVEYAEQGRAYLFPDTRLQFLTLNSCWELDQFHRKHSGVHPAAVAHVIAQAREQITQAETRGALNKGDKVLRLAVWHHSVAGPEMMKDTSFIGHLQNIGVKVCLHGDIHKMERNLIGYYDKNRRIHVVGAGSFGSPPEGRPESTPRLYNLLEVSPDLTTIRVHTRSQATPDGPWEGWYKWPSTGNARVPYYDIKL